LRRRRPRPGDKWHRDAVFISINGVRHSLWRAVDQEGNVLATLVQSRRDKAAAKQFVRRLRKGLASVPRVVSTDTRASDGAAKREALPSVEQRQHQGRNNRAENAHQPTRERERRRRRCKSPGHAQRCLAADGPIAAHCRPCRHRLSPAQHGTLCHLAGGHRHPGAGLSGEPPGLTTPLTPSAPPDLTFVDNAGTGYHWEDPSAR